MNSKLYCINPNTKEYEEVKTIFGINIEEILDLIRDYKISKDLKFDKFGKLEEIERLNNIINELEKTFKRDLESILDFEEKHPEAILSRFPEYYLEQLKELKGSDKE